MKDEELVDRAFALFEAYRAGQIELIAPFAVYYELPSSILKATRRGRIGAADAREAVDLFAELELAIPSPAAATLRELLSQSYGVAERLARSFYDAIFVSTAANLDLPLLTADKSLFEAVQGLSLPVTWLGDFEVP